MRPVVLISLLVLPFAARAEGAARAAVAIDFAPPSSGPRWYSDALAQLLARELGRFHRVAVTEPLDGASCPGREPDCLARLYGGKGVDVVVLGEITGDSLRYDVWETWSLARAFRGSIAVSGPNVSSSRVQHEISEIVRPIVGSGGLLDQRPVAAPAPAAAAPVQSSAVPLEYAVAALAAALFLLAWPPLLLFMLLGKRLRRLLTWKWSLLLALGLVAFFFARGWFAPGPLLIAVLGGLCWGALVVLTVALLLPPIHGLSRIRHDALGPTLRAWLWLCGLRASLALFFFPIASLVALVPLESALRLSLAMPLAGLFGCFWFLSLTDHLSAYLDERLIDGPASRANPWHATARKYFGGYVRRGGVVLKRDFLDTTLFLPGKPGVGADETRVLAYGGGLTPLRVVIGVRALHLAFGELPDEPEAPERTVNPEELPEGFVIPSDEDATTRTSTRAEKQRKKLGRAAPRKKAATPRLLGEPVTALGWVVPQPVDSAVPLISNTREDYEVVKSLLTEHYARFEKNLDEDAHDDTDPSQKDFLFGALMVAAGGATRGDNLLSTVGLSLQQARPWASWPSRRLLRFGTFIYGRFLAWPRAAIADAYAALNQALHHRIQHLHLERGGDEKKLTARADAPRLVALSKALLEEQTRTGADSFPAQRMLWLSAFFGGRLAPRRARWPRVLALAAVSVLAVFAVGAALKEAVDYRHLYLERMTQVQTLATEAKKTQGAPVK